MEELLASAAKGVEIAVEAVAVLVVAMGSVEALIGVVRVMLRPSLPDAVKREVWIHYARWLVVALTFQLAADIVHTAGAPTWDDIGRLAAVAVIRTFLTYFLDRDMEHHGRAEAG